MLRHASHEGSYPSCAHSARSQREWPPHAPLSRTKRATSPTTGAGFTFFGFAAVFGDTAAFRLREGMVGGGEGSGGGSGGCADAYCPQNEGSFSRVRTSSYSAGLTGRRRCPISTNAL